ncbi:hypothetical protein [Flammeovirga sp. SJP92]|uniref:hypothetical protein n=1 Tax=Flammeovirga sp. SJP92 TaxID=1775430 RepID=UPI0007872D6D|nr:hypothetical protein [Flammeovirga sp. SJP92]KXX67959.1 hypothetical protein AVL50_24180 [Flammeovirga sp. SJP92]
MKKSNIYLISLLSSVTLFIITGAVVSVARGKPEKNENSFTQKVPAYSYISLQNTNYYVSIATADSYEFKVYLEKDVEQIEIPYTIKGDTLVLSELPKERAEGMESLQLSLPLETLNIIAKSSNIGFNEFKGSSLKLELDGSEGYMRNREGKGLSNLEISGTNNSNFDSHLACDSIRLNLDKSNFNNWGDTQFIEGKLINKASVTQNNPGETNLSKDATSQIHYYYND